MASKKKTAKLAQLRHTAPKVRPLKDVLLAFAKAENELTKHPEFDTADWALETVNGVCLTSGDIGVTPYTKITITPSIDTEEIEVN